MQKPFRLPYRRNQETEPFVVTARRKPMDLQTLADDKIQNHR